jgi:rhodanese-related sulfurtransferase
MPAKSYHDLVAEAKTRVKEVSPAETERLRRGRDDAVVVDIREPNETNLGRIPGAYVIPRGILEQNIERVASREQPVVLYCASGNRSALAAATLQEMGYTDVASMSGGFRGWVESGGDVEG